MIDVAAGDKIPRKNGPGISLPDILVINRTDLAPYVHASLEVMENDAPSSGGGEGAVLAVIALGLIVPMTAGDYDLSIASVTGMSAMIIAVLNVLHGWPVGLAVLVALAAGLMVGVVNGFVTVAFGIESLIVTLGMGTFVAGLTLWISNSNTVSGISQNLVNPIVVWRFLGIPVEFYYALGVALILGYMMEFFWEHRHTCRTSSTVQLWSGPSCSRN